MVNNYGEEVSACLGPSDLDLKGNDPKAGVGQRSSRDPRVRALVVVRIESMEYWELT